MKIAILACGTLLAALKAAQEKLGTDYPMFIIDRKYHAEPKDMREQVARTLERIPEEFDTVLIAMGFCGGSLEGISDCRRLVIPRVDDCVTMMMQKEGEFSPNTKAAGHFYVIEEELRDFAPSRILEKLKNTYKPHKAEKVFAYWFQGYTKLDIVETGLYDTHSPEFTEKMQREAELIHSEVDYAEGSNLLLEALLKGDWDNRFVIAEPGEALKQADFETMPPA